MSALIPVCVARLVAIPAGWPWRCVGELCVCVWGELGLGEGAGRPLEVGFGPNPAGNKARERDAEGEYGGISISPAEGIRLGFVSKAQGPG